MGLTVDGSLVLTDVKDGISLIDRDGTMRYRKPLPSCGSVRGLAIDKKGMVTRACGYSLTRVDPAGSVVFQKWPFGDSAVGLAWVDGEGVVYVSGGGVVAALETDGSTRWTVPLGDNRAASQLAWNDSGHLVFDTSRDDRHFAPDYERNELFEVDRQGQIVRRTPYEEAPPKGGWPKVLLIPEDGAHRVE